MGLPDFHSSRGSYTQLVRDDDLVVITDLAETDILNYDGYGEVIEAHTAAIQDTVQLNRGDIVRLYTDGVQVHAENLDGYLDGNFHSGYSLIVPVYFNPFTRFHFNLSRGIFFNTNITLTYQKLNVGNINVGIAWSIGLY